MKLFTKTPIWIFNPTNGTFAKGNVSDLLLLKWFSVTGLVKHFYLGHFKSKMVTVILKTECQKLCKSKRFFISFNVTQLII